MCRLLFQIQRMSGVQAAFDALCYAAYVANCGAATTCSLSRGRGLG